MYVDTRGIDIAPHLLMRGDWEPDDLGLFARMIRPGDTVLDVGAHLGVYALIGAAATGPSGKVHAFEPNPRLAQLARRSILVNGFGPNTVIHEVAVGEAEGLAQLMFSDEWSGGGYLATPTTTGAGHDCRVIALDEVFPDQDFKVGVMKMDVEGTEGRALRGMTGLLSRSPDARIMMEFAPQMMAGQSAPVGDVVAFLVGLGFMFWTIGPGGTLQSISPESLAALTSGVRNIVAARKLPILA
jgi:FkbM family methyltransferase